MPGPFRCAVTVAPLICDRVRFGMPRGAKTPCSAASAFHASRVDPSLLLGLESGTGRRW